MHGAISTRLRKLGEISICVVAVVGGGGRTYLSRQCRELADRVAPKRASRRAQSNTLVCHAHLGGQLHVPGHADIQRPTAWVAPICSKHTAQKKAVDYTKNVVATKQRRCAPSHKAGGARDHLLCNLQCCQTLPTRRQLDITTADHGGDGRYHQLGDVPN